MAHRADGGPCLYAKVVTYSCAWPQMVSGGAVAATVLPGPGQCRPDATVEQGGRDAFSPLWER